MSRREHASTPRLYAGVLYGDVESFSISDVQRWQDWLASHRTFYADLLDGSFTARRDDRGDTRCFWYAYRRVDGNLYKVYLGRSQNLTIDRLNQVVAQLGAKVAS